ncbi:MAG: 50S ribosomal protein L15 [Candidatus Dormibacteria bacterium]
MRVDQLKPASGSRRSPKRVGRGIAAGGGKTAGRGQKGQGARSSWSLPRAFEGGQMPLTQRVPKLRGFYNRFRVEYQVVNCGKLARFEAGAVVDLEQLRTAGLIRHQRQPTKLLAGGGTPPKLTIQVHKASRAAAAAIAKAGGTIQLLGSDGEVLQAEPAVRPSRRRRAAPQADPSGTAEEPRSDPAESPTGGQDSTT